jgi:type I restriction enzyme S subunit
LPLTEQQRIVSLLDEAFAGIATAIANAEKNLQNARDLFESQLQSAFTRRGKGWVETTLGKEIDLLAGFAFKSAQYSNKEKDIRLLRGDNIIQGCLRWDDVKRWPANDTKEYERYELCEGDVVLAMDRPWVKAGLKHATIAADDLPCLLVQRTARLRGGPNLENPFLKLLIGSSAFSSHILGVQTGIGVPHISGQQIKDFEFARPPVAEQKHIADNLELLRDETQRLASIYERKLAALEALKKSLLHQAFTGQL